MRDKSFYKEKAEAIKNDVWEIQKNGEIFNIEDPLIRIREYMMLLGSLFILYLLLIPDFL